MPFFLTRCFNSSPALLPILGLTYFPRSKTLAQQVLIINTGFFFLFEKEADPELGVPPVTSSRNSQWTNASTTTTNSASGMELAISRILLWSFSVWIARSVDTRLSVLMQQMRLGSVRRIRCLGWRSGASGGGFWRLVFEWRNAIGTTWFLGGYHWPWCSISVFAIVRQLTCRFVSFPTRFAFVEP